MASKNLIVLAQSVRTITTSNVSRSTSANIPEGYHKLKHIQAKFQVKDGKPIYLKGGTMDEVLYRITMGLSLLGLVGIGKVIYDESFPKTA